MKVSRQMLHEDLQASAVYRQQMLAKHLFRYEWSTKLAQRLFSAKLPGQVRDSISVEERCLPTSDGGAKIRVKVYRPKSSSGKLPPMLYTHGGGYITGAPEPFAGAVARFIERRPCVVAAPAYRTAFVKPYPGAFDDCYMTLLWMRDNADELGIDASKFMIAGHSAGGGLTAAVTLKARDTGDVRVALQMPFYPMIDDQQPSDPARDMDAPGWDNKTNAFGWASY
ncbi:MAG: alpha/beta hydrolase, partial [Gammaproteobacteria bacterium]|nr:alpha/beta hydrolase [Gammaproteobacteria bacterium]